MLVVRDNKKNKKNGQKQASVSAPVAANLERSIGRLSNQLAKRSAQDPSGAPRGVSAKGSRRVAGMPTVVGHNAARRGLAAVNRPSGNFSAAFEKSVREIMYRCAFPDLTDPVCYGFSRSALTTPNKLFYKFAVPWSSQTTALANQLPVNEAWLILLSAHPSIAMIYLDRMPNATVFQKQLQFSGNNLLQLKPNNWVPFSGATVSPVTATGQSYENALDSPDVQANAIWLESNTNMPLTLTLQQGATNFTATTTYNINYLRRSGGDLNVGMMTMTTGGAAVSAITFTLPANKAGYYSFWLGSNFVQNQTANFNIGCTVIGESGITRHEPLPSNVGAKFETCRTNSARATLTNTAGPFGAEGAAAAYEMPSADAWYEFVYPNALPVPSVLSACIAQDGAVLIEDIEGCSVAAHPRIDSDPVDCQSVSEVTGVIVSQTNPQASYPHSALCGGVLLCMRTALTATAARDGYWQIHYHTESETGDQTYTKYPPMYSPLEVLEAQSRFRAFRAITGNPDHFVKGLTALRKLTGTVDRVGDGLVSTVVGAPLGGSVKGASAAVKAFLGAMGH